MRHVFVWFDLIELDSLNLLIQYTICEFFTMQRTCHFLCSRFNYIYWFKEILVKKTEKTTKIVVFEQTNVQYFLNCIWIHHDRHSMKTYRNNFIINVYSTTLLNFLEWLNKNTTNFNHLIHIEKDFIFFASYYVDSVEVKSYTVFYQTSQSFFCCSLKGQIVTSRIRILQSIAKLYIW